MRKEIIECETCQKEHSAENPLPREWWILKKEQYYCNDEPDRHFCSDECLATWLQKRGHAVVPTLEKTQEPQDTLPCKARRFLLVDEQAEITEGVKWQNGSVDLDDGSEHLKSTHCRGYFSTWDEFKEDHEGCGIQWVDHRTGGVIEPGEIAVVSE